AVVLQTARANPAFEKAHQQALQGSDASDDPAAMAVADPVMDQWQKENSDAQNHPPEDSYPQKSNKTSQAGLPDTPEVSIPDDGHLVKSAAPASARPPEKNARQQKAALG
ncbi:hypothetical protein MXD81_15550, partial [Microbacteriaceae bacterium K1510]|nr:hypothetical protein [Microbacteriaceae bacterium K1510]